MLQTKSLRCERGDRVLFDNLSFALSPGEMLRIEGANGSGKTTLLRMLCGLYQDFDGEVLWDLPDYPLYLGHKAGVKDHLTARENIEWLSCLYGANVTSRQVEGALADFHLGGYADVPCRSMSQGQRKRVNLARLALLESPAWVLDEPFSSIDSEGVAHIEALITQQLERGGLVILTSHQPVSVEGVTQTVRLGPS